MADPITVDFDMDPTALVDLLTRKNEKARQVVVAGLLLLVGVLAVLLSVVALAVLCFALTAIVLAAIVKLPKVRQAMALRLAGPTKVVFSHWGMEFTGANVAERVPWARFQRVYDRPGRWTLQTRTPVVLFIVPKSAVPPEHREQFIGRLADWAGPAYKFRKH